MTEPFADRRRKNDDIAFELRRFLYGENGDHIGFYEWSRSVNEWMRDHDEEHQQQKRDHERAQQNIGHLVKTTAKELLKTALAIVTAIVLLHFGVGGG